MGKGRRRPSARGTIARSAAEVERATQHLQAAIAALEQDDGPRAARHLDAVLQLAPSNPDARALRGIAANRMGDFSRAARDLGAAVRAFGAPRSDTRDAHNEYALALRGTGD